MTPVNDDAPRPQSAPDRPAQSDAGKTSAAVARSATGEHGAGAGSLADAGPAGAPAVRKPPRWRRWAVDLALFAGIFLAIQAWMARDVPAGPAPDFATVGADGRPLSLAAWRAAHPGEAVGVYFWAEWCPICTAQQGTIDGVQADHPVLTVAMQSGDAAAVAKVLAARGLGWTTAIDADGSIAQTYGLRGVPAFVVVDAAGAIRSVSLGYTTGWGLRARLWWAGLGG